MTTILSQKGQIVLPAAIRERLALEPGDDFEITVDEDEIITLRRITQRPNTGLVDHLLACPEPLEIPERSKDLPRAVDFGEAS